MRQHLIPALLLQPLVENAIKYAVSEVKGAAQIRVAVRKCDSHIHLSLADNGPGAALAAGWPLQASSGSLQNLAERLSLLFGSKARLAFQQQDQLFTGEISLPLESLDAID